ncbi:MAG TPA: tRNA (adenosine(37)-N6)-dimethylallyltransferase MiaA [Burkholderiales bacterium]|nr:tRNA (adenosine(37)-N6)-dimethylallyltransferase MiaA [Burkholderiales bacterium]
MQNTLNPKPSTLNMEKWPPAILLIGPTASGKTTVALELMKKFPCEIISVDSAQIYRGMDIGTAKPDAGTLGRVPHHLIDILEPTERYSAAQFREDALKLMREICARGRIPLLVGGTMLYFKALREGLSELPPADPAMRAVIDAMADASGWPALHQKLSRLDPITAARLEPTDAQRIQRALEICYITGKPMSRVLGQSEIAALPYRVTAIGFTPGDRAVLHQRIGERFGRMLANGLIGEVESLRSRYDLNRWLPSMRCVGYRQVWQYLDGEFDQQQMREKGVAATRQLAKRQLTWLRSMAEVKTFDCLTANLPQKVETYLETILEQK